MNQFEQDIGHACIWCAPFFLAYAIGAILAAIWWRQHPLSAKLVFAGSILGAVSLGTFVLWVFVWFPDLDVVDDRLDAFDSLIWYGTPYLEAIGFLLVVTAAFVGRREERRVIRYFDEE